MAWLVETVQSQVTAPLCIDSPNPKALEIGLSLCKHGQPMINSITAEKDRYATILPFVLKYKANKTYYDFYEHILSRAIMLNNHCNVNDLLSHNEVNQICKSICKWTWRNFSQSRFSEIQSARARKNTAPRKTKESGLKLFRAIFHQPFPCKLLH